VMIPAYRSSRPRSSIVQAQSRQSRQFRLTLDFGFRTGSGCGWRDG
jgi:hypothetical protein